jgi:AraC family transcriptional regulator of adaptative response / DNA-3-methyladenine glycosylase II
LTLRLGYREPFSFSTLLAFLKVRAIPGVEQVDAQSYARTVVLAGQVSTIRITKHELEPVLLLSVEGEHSAHLYSINQRVRKLFDLDADPMAVNDVLERDPKLKQLVTEAPGQRVPGCWSPFEIAVRAVVGQQVSVKGATTVMGRIASQYGQQTDHGLCFPGPAELSQLDVTALSMPRSRAQAIQDMSRLVAAGEIRFDPDVTSETLIDQLLAIKGIGPWTAQYIAMRALNDPDAFLDGDLVLLKVAARYLGIEGRSDLQARAELLARAEQWRPWRAYAGMHLWRAAAKLENR